MRRRLIVLVMTGSLLLLGGGFALGAAVSGPSPGMQTMGHMTAACDTMHRSAVMREMLRQMPTDLRDRCDAMHGQMLLMMQTSEQRASMMGGSDMMGGS